jgi:ORF6N domain
VTDIIHSINDIENLIYIIRNHKVILDEDLAKLYQVETRMLTRAIRRNIVRFPADFCFELLDQEVISLRSQIGISKTGRGGRRYPPLVFTEQGVSMLSSDFDIEEGLFLL